MNEILDFEEKEISTNYRKWAFRFFIYLIILNLLTFLLIIDFNSFTDNGQELNKKLLISNWAGWILSITVIFFCIMMIRFKEPKDYKYWTPIIGMSLAVVINIVLYFI